MSVNLGENYQWQNRHDVTQSCRTNNTCEITRQTRLACAWSCAYLYSNNIFYCALLKKGCTKFRPPLCTYRLNWARRTSWGGWDEWNDTVLQTQDSKFEPWRSEAEHATSRSRRLSTILSFTRGWGRNIFVSFKPPRPWTEPRNLAWKAAVLTTTLGPSPKKKAQRRISSGTYSPPPPYSKSMLLADNDIRFFVKNTVLHNIWEIRITNCEQSFA